jgi:hypothetical protein
VNNDTELEEEVLEAEEEAEAISEKEAQAIKWVKSTAKLGVPCLLSEQDQSLQPMTIQTSEQTSTIFTMQ